VKITDQITTHPYRPDNTAEPGDACNNRGHHGFMCGKPRADHVEEIVKVADMDAARDTLRDTLVPVPPSDRVRHHVVPADPAEAPEPVWTIESCRSCRRAIIWAKNVVSGRLAPIDAAPSAAGNVHLTSRQGIPSYAVLGPPAIAAMSSTVQARLRTSHFASCPDANRWRSA
jgi:hypothetical protein